MDSLILEGVLRILERTLSGRSLLAWDRLADGVYLLRFATAAGDNLKVSLRSPYPALYRLPHRDTPKTVEPDPFSGLAARELEGATLHGLSRRGCDRVVEMSWVSPEGGRRKLVAELLGKSGNLLLLDSEDRVAAFARGMASTFRAPEVGKAYQPPVPRPGLEGATLDPDQVEGMLRRFDPAASPLESSVGLLKFLSPSLSADFPHREGALRDPVSEMKSILKAAREDRLEPVMYTAVPPEEMMSQPDKTPEPPVLSPLPLAQCPLPIQTRFRDCEEAVRVATRLMEARLKTRELREKLSGALHREGLRLEKLVSKLGQERAEATRSEVHQRYGDLILACPEAKVQGEVIVVPDLYQPGGAPARIPADPALSARGNAEKHYSRARKLRRGAAKIEERQRAADATRATLDEWRRKLDHSENLESLERLELEMVRGRILNPPKQRGDSRQEPASENDQGIRKYRTEDGYVILVGKTSRDNDRLTFHVAAPHDFWFHAADRSGAHVVVRNPSRLKELPRPVALSAARLAAHFSRARGKGRVEVHYTLRKHVRKGKGYAPGLVTLRDYRTLEVEPGIPGQGEN
ncbi:MAG: NFACT RNA binding domain-containing protein [Acidobacteria bacterium]|nr:NFACT RNA binding domain-containing protein [Acidobacteriota bacterium]